MTSVDVSLQYLRTLQTSLLHLGNEDRCADKFSLRYNKMEQT